MKCMSIFFPSQTMEIILILHVLYYCCPLKRPVSLYECKNELPLYNYVCIHALGETMNRLGCTIMHVEWARGLNLLLARCSTC